MTSNPKKELSFKEKLTRLFRIDDKIFYLYSTYEDPISGKIKAEDRAEIIKESAKIGHNLATKLTRELSNKSVADYIKEQDIELVIEEKQGKTKYIYFGTYESSGSITLYKGNLVKSRRLLADEKIHQLTADQVSEVVLTHELFHYFEDIYPDIYTNTKKIKLWKLGPYTHTSNLICPGEIGAMAFAKELLNLNFNSSAINYVLYSSIDKNAGEAFYENIMALDEKVSKNK